MDEAGFRDLVAGKSVTLKAYRQEVRLILADIGWARMARVIVDAMSDRVKDAEGGEA